MIIKEFFKKNGYLRRFVKKIKIYREFFYDAMDFSDNYEEVAEKKGDYKYRLLLYIHNLEKGMCMEYPRPFGKEKVETIIKIINKATSVEIEQFEYQLAISVLKSWAEFYEEKGWDIGNDMQVYIRNLRNSNIHAGAEKFKNTDAKKGNFEEVIFTRRSVRDFSEKPLEQVDIDFAVKCFIAAPTACNRQMCKIYKIEKNDYKVLLQNKILGIGGFNLNTVNLFVITYDISAFEFYGERNQGYLNVGLVAMNFANGLHARGIGSCFMQWSNDRADDYFIRTNLGIPETERIGVIIGAGYYRDEVLIPKSTRKTKELVCKIL